MSVQVAHLLVEDEDVPRDVRQAIAEGRLEDAGFLLMHSFELTCEEASALVDRSIC